MSRSRRQPAGPRCVECRQPIEPGADVVERELPAGNRAGLVHRMVTERWHASCWTEVGLWVEESQARAEARQRDEVRALAAACGLPDPYAEES